MQNLLCSHHQGNSMEFPKKKATLWSIFNERWDISKFGNKYYSVFFFRIAMATVMTPAHHLVEQHDTWGSSI